MAEIILQSITFMVQSMPFETVSLFFSFSKIWTKMKKSFSNFLKNFSIHVNMCEQLLFNTFNTHVPLKYSKFFQKIVCFNSVDVSEKEEYICPFDTHFSRTICAWLVKGGKKLLTTKISHRSVEKYDEKLFFLLCLTVLNSKMSYLNGVPFSIFGLAP